MSNKLNVTTFYKTLSDILSEKYHAQITFTAVPKGQAEDIDEKKETA